MAEEEIVALAASPVPSDHKRKLEDLETEGPEPDKPSPDLPADLNAEPDAAKLADDVAATDESEAKRPRLDDKPDGLASENGFQAEKSDEPVNEKEEEPSKEIDQTEDAEATSEEVQVTVKTEEVQVTVITEEVEVTVTTEQPSPDNHEVGQSDQVSVENSEVDNALEPSKEETQKPSAEVPQQEVDYSAQQVEPTSEGLTMTHKMEVPNNKVGVLIGKAGDTIRYLQYNSGAKIQIMRDADADPQSTTRPVEIIGTLSNIKKAEKLISAVIAEADAGGSPSLVARGLATSQATGVAEQIEIQVPNEKVGLIIGRGGDTIKGLQTRSGARIQLIPQHLPEGDGSKERTVRVTGDKKQIEMAREMIKEVMNQTVRPSPLSSSFNQQAYRPRGPTGQPQWGPRGPHSAQPMAYDYQQRGSYPSQNPQYPPPTYGNYPQQMASRSNFGSGWEQRPSSMQGPPQSGGYDYYGGQGGHGSDHPISASHSGPIPGHATGPSSAPTMGPPSQANYNYGQQGLDYGHPASYSQTTPQQSYGHGYDETKYENHAPVQQPYGGHGSSQPVYPQPGTQPGYAPQQQYGKPPSYAMPSQGLPPQSYGHPRASQPGDTAYQGPIPSAQSYNPNVPPQQQFPYASSGTVQQSYPPYGSAPAPDGYNQAPPSSGPGYPQQGGQHVPGYNQPGGQHAPSYGQVVNPTGGYGSYPSSQQGYPEQQGPNNAGYGYQGPQDPGYGGGSASAYGATPGVQPGYAQPGQTQQSYDQSATQSGGYGAAPASAPVGYGKTVSPQPGYPQYDSTQMYAAPR